MKKLVILFFYLISFNAYSATNVQTINNAGELQNALRNNKVVVAEFFSPQCPHCKSFARAGIFERLATELPDCYFIKVSSGTGTETAEDVARDQLHAQYAISAYPTFIVFQNGTKVGKRIGFQHTEPLRRFINDSIGK